MLDCATPARHATIGQPVPPGYARAMSDALAIPDADTDVDPRQQVQSDPQGCVEGRAEGAISPLELVTDRDVEPIDAGHLGIDGTKGTHDVAVQPGPIVHRT